MNSTAMMSKMYLLSVLFNLILIFVMYIYPSLILYLIDSLIFISFHTVLRYFMIWRLGIGSYFYFEWKEIDTII